jgi:alanyl-tRNA synthetase
MATQRLYYFDSYTTTFDAEISGQTTYSSAPAVILNQTYFYPTSGGQPNDTGVLNGVPVVDVAVRESDGAVLHVLEGELPPQPVSGQIDWARRFDHMRHHTGQHILSQAFIRLAQAETVGFHLSPDSVTIDLNKAALPASLVDEVEDLANQIIAENRPVRAWFPTEDELARIQLRKVPEVGGKLRIVDIGGFDLTACGGTHVAHTGEIGLVKVLRADKRGDGLRVEFRCGERALLDYRQKHSLMSQLAVELTTGYTEIPAALERLRDQNKALQRELRTLRTEMLENEAQLLWQSADHSAGFARVTQAFEGRDTGDVRQLVQHLVAHPATVAICGAAGEKAQLIAACSDDLPFDMVPVLRRGLAVWGVERGGGRPSFAQGGGVNAALADVRAAVSAAVEALPSIHQ